MRGDVLSSGSILTQEFYERDPAYVARDLLGKVLVRKCGDSVISGVIVETEAYYGLHDPASRAFKGVKNYNRAMWEQPGRLFIYNVHKFWMLNVVAHEIGEIGAVLIRAIQPSEGLNIIRRNRFVKKAVDLTNGPGKLTVALKIDKQLNQIPVFSLDSEITINDRDGDFSIESSHRIGVKHDLDRKLRFFIRGNQFVSR